MDGDAFGLGLIAIAKNSSKQAGEYLDECDARALKKLKYAHEDFVFRVKGQVHGLRSALHGRRVVEDDLIAALKAENANHPLASREAVEEAVLDARAAALLNPEVIKKTYPDGILPKGVITPPNGVTVAV